MGSFDICETKQAGMMLLHITYVIWDIKFCFVLFFILSEQKQFQKK